MDDDLHEHSHLMTDAGELSAVAHMDGCCGPHSSHATPLSACDAPCAAQFSPVHPSPLRSMHRRWLHCLMPSCCTSEDVEIVNVIFSRRHLYHATRHHELYNFVQCGDIGDEEPSRKSFP